MAAKKHAERAAPVGTPPQAEKFFAVLFVFYKKEEKNRRKAEKGFNFVCAKPPLRRAESRFAEPRAFRKGNGFILFACTKRTKSTPEVCEPLDSGERFKSPLDT